jgi:hypothetical protein
MRVRTSFPRRVWEQNYTCGLKGRYTKAQGEALGSMTGVLHEALKVRDEIVNESGQMMPPFQGFVIHISFATQGCAPWADTGRPFRPLRWRRMKS